MNHLHHSLRAWRTRMQAAWRHATARRDFEKLDPAALRDLGLSASEFDSFWAESRGSAERTRLHTARHAASPD
jgi:hypothetical protein